jgi:hypothetical protein
LKSWHLAKHFSSPVLKQKKAGIVGARAPALPQGLLFFEVEAA